MPLSVERMLNNAEPLVDDRRGVIGDKDYTALFRDLQCNVLTAHGCQRMHYLFVRFREGDDSLRNVRYLLGMLARSAFERLMVRQAIENPDAKELMTPLMREVAETWKNGAPSHITAAQHALLCDVRVMSEYEIYGSPNTRVGVNSAGPSPA